MTILQVPGIMVDIYRRCKFYHKTQKSRVNQGTYEVYTKSSTNNVPSITIRPGRHAHEQQRELLLQRERGLGRTTTCIRDVEVWKLTLYFYPSAGGFTKKKKEKKSTRAHAWQKHSSIQYQVWGTNITTEQYYCCYWDISSTEKLSRRRRQRKQLL